MTATTLVKFIYPEDETDATSGSIFNVVEADPGTAIWSKEAIAPQVYRSQVSNEAPNQLTTDATPSLGNETNPYAGRTTPLAEAVDEMTQLSIMASLGDKRAFIVAQQAINWATKSANDFSQALQLSMSVGAFEVARHLAFAAVKYHPQNKALQTYARLLAPPKVSRSDLLPDPTIKTNQAWLKVNRAAYQGQWVALEDGRCLGVANSLKALIEQVGRSDTILMTKVY